MRRFLYAGAVLGFFFIGTSSVVHADTLGDVRNFQVNATYDAHNASTIAATARAVGQHAYYYVDDRYWANLSDFQRNAFSGALDRLVTAFDGAIYPRATALWGSEPNPGIDGDPRMTILIEEMGSNVGGYFQTVNEYTQAQAPTSNAREMVYVNAASVRSDSVQGFLAHEFEHLISFNQKDLLLDIHDDLWLDEARAEYDITAVGFDDPFTNSTLERRMRAFMSAPSDSLVEWPNTTIDYAIASVFIHYVADRFGPDVLARTIHSPANGIDALQESLVQAGAPHFSDVFSDWMVASLINDLSVDGKYLYARTGLQSLHVPVQQTLPLNGTTASQTTVALKEWQPFWLRFDGASTISTPTVALRVTADPGPGADTWVGGAVIATYADGHRRVIPFQAVANVPVMDSTSHLASMIVALGQGNVSTLGARTVMTRTLTVIATPGDVIAVPTPTPTTDIHDGDLIRRPGEAEVYVVWGKYRRYLPDGVLALYGFQDRPVTAVPDEVFNRYTTSNYIRVVDGTTVYAAWPDGTKHWLNITPAQWDASARDWGAIFTINEAEVNFYTTGPDITR